MANSLRDAGGEMTAKRVICPCNRYQKVMISHLPKAEQNFSDRNLGISYYKQDPVDSTTQCLFPDSVCDHESCTCRAIISKGGTTSIFAKLLQVLSPDALTTPIGPNDRDWNLKIHGHRVHYNLTAEARARYKSMTSKARDNCLKTYYGVKASFSILNAGGKTNPKHEKWLEGLRDGIRKELLNIAKKDKEENTALFSSAIAATTEVNKDTVEKWASVSRVAVHEAYEASGLVTPLDSGNCMVQEPLSASSGEKRPSNTPPLAFLDNATEVSAEGEVNRCPESQATSLDTGSKASTEGELDHPKQENHAQEKGTGLGQYWQEGGSKESWKDAADKWIATIPKDVDKIQDTPKSDETLEAVVKGEEYPDISDQTGNFLSASMSSISLSISDKDWEMVDGESSHGAAGSNATQATGWRSWLGGYAGKFCRG